MKILHIVPTYLPATRYGGPIESVHGLCKALARLGCEVHVFTTNVDGPDDSQVPLNQPVDLEGVKVWYFPSRILRRLYYSPLMQRALEQKISQFDLVHLHSIFLWPTGAGARVARKAGIPYILSPRGMLVKELIQKKNHWVKSAWIQFIERQNLENAAAVHFTSELEKKEAERFGFRLPRPFVVPNGVEITKQKGTGQNPDLSPFVGKELFILFLGRINWKKGLDRLIPAMKFVPGISLVIAGNDEENYRPQLEKLANSSGVSERVKFIGPVYGDEKAALFARAALFVLPSYSENFGIAALEAMASGCPVVATPEVGLADTVRETGCGLVVKGEPEVLGPAIQDLLSKPNLLKTMGEKGKDVVRERFTWDKIAGEMGKVYLQVLAQ